MQKTYHALLRGWLDGSTTLDYPLVEELDKIADKFATEQRAPQPAVADYHILAHVEMPVAIGKFNTACYTLVEMSPRTGRKHQLCRHIAHLRHPIIGDSSRGDLRQNRGAATYFWLDRVWQQMQQQFGWQHQLPDVLRVEFASEAFQDKPTE